MEYKLIVEILKDSLFRESVEKALASKESMVNAFPMKFLGSNNEEFANNKVRQSILTSAISNDNKVDNPEWDHMVELTKQEYFENNLCSITSAQLQPHAQKLNIFDGKLINSLLNQIQLNA